MFDNNIFFRIYFIINIFQIYAIEIEQLFTLLLKINNVDTYGVQ